MQDSSRSVHLPPVMSLRAFGFKDAGKEKEAVGAAGVWESRAKRELAEHVHGRWGGGGEVEGEGDRGEGGQERERREEEGERGREQK